MRKFSSYRLSLIQDCDLRCRYCSTGFGRWGKKPHKMPPETVDQTVAFMIQNSGDQFKVSLSGGENLLDPDLLRYFLDHLLAARKKSGQKLSIGLATNGVKLTPEIAGYLIDSQVAISISLDGDAETTNRNRKLSNGQGIYQIVSHNVAQCRDLMRKKGFSNTRLRAECTLDELATIDGSVAHLFDMGFTDVLIRPTDVSPYTNWPPKLPIEHFFKLFREAVGRYLQSVSLFDILSGKQKKSLINIQAPLICLLTGLQCPDTCGILTHSICIKSNGTLIPCFMFDEAANRDYIVGNIWDGVDHAKAMNLLKLFHGIAPNCNSCSYNRMCRRGCHWSFIQESAADKSVEEFEYCRLNKGCSRILREEVQKRFKGAVHPSTDVG